MHSQLNKREIEQHCIDKKYVQHKAQSIVTKIYIVMW